MRNKKRCQICVLGIVPLTLVIAGLSCQAALIPKELPIGTWVSATSMIEMGKSTAAPATPSPASGGLSQAPKLTASSTAAITMPPPTVDVSASASTLAPLPSVTSGPSPTFPPLSQDAWCIPWNAPAVQAPVLRVIDGTTIEVLLGGEPQQIAYSGLEMLDYTDDWRVWEQMQAANRDLVEGKVTTLIGGGPGSLMEEPQLRYVLVGNVFVNLELVRGGYALARTTPPETSCDDLLRMVEEDARVAQRGLWAPAPTPTRTLRPPTAVAAATGTLVIVKVNYHGIPWQEPDEFVEIRNVGFEAVQLAGWSVRDAQNHAFIFPEFILGVGQYCRVTTNEYQPEHCGFSFYRPSPVWDNDGDCAYLQDSQGRLIDEFCY